MPPQDYNSQFVQDTTAAADQAARAEYNSIVAQTGRDDLALRQAQQKWKETMDRAGLTGMFEGEWTMDSNKYFADTFGSWGAPTAGQDTLAKQNQYWTQGYREADLYGMGEGGRQTLAGNEQQYTQGLRDRQQALAEQSQQQKTAQEYLNLLSSLRGPADWAKYQEVLGSTPGGLRDLTAAAMGQYIPGGGATTGVQPTPVSLQSMYQQVAGQPQAQQYAQTQQAYGVQQPGMEYAGGAPGTATGSAQDRYQQAAQQQYQQYNPSQQGGTPGAQPDQAMQATQQQYAQQQNQQPYTGGVRFREQGGQQQGQQTNQMGQLPLPNQIAPQAWKNMAPSQQQMLLGSYENKGWHKPDVEALLNQSLPKYGSNAPSAGTWRLR